MNKIIDIKNLSKSYNDILAVDDVSYNVAKGEMFGLVGPDGAGKTTTIRTLCGLLITDSGEIEVLGYNLLKERKKIQNKIGYLSQKFSLYGDLTVDENIEFFADIHGVKDYENRSNELLEFTRLTPFKDRLAEKLSGGMKQKLALACSLIHKPQIIFLDEPTTGVDPVSRRDFWKILSNLLKEGITIFMSTPYLDEAERCNRVALMSNGKIISLDTPQKIKGSLEKDVIEIVCNKIREAYKLIQQNFPFEIQMFGDRINIIVDEYETDYKRIEKLLNDNSIEILNHRLITPSLENVFIHLVQEAN
ncbi:ABC transporter ATP-binding protein [bacterium BMS3Abin03]|jgi:ABC-2 type transport system ATP-binding protein|nr:ABC transporter ATP-binding protein [bacterium BMS3Abin03]MCG6960120.1 ABC transporter ATP-binding protein [bacterium BMS3Abin03]